MLTTLILDDLDPHTGKRRVFQFGTANTLLPKRKKRTSKICHNKPVIAIRDRVQKRFEPDTANGLTLEQASEVLRQVAFYAA